MRYERYAPGPALADYVEHFWLIEADLGKGWHEEILVPNGRPTLLVSLGTPGRRRDPQTLLDVPNSSGLSGISTGPVVIGQRDQVRLVAAQLRPFGPAAFGSDAHIDQHVSLNAWDTPAAVSTLEADLSGLGVSEAAIRRLEDQLANRLAPLPPGALAQLDRAYAALDGDLPEDINAWAAQAGMTYGQLYRVFRAHVGLAPKTALMIARYQTLIGGLLAKNRGDSLAQLALLQGYYDQAHANRDFRRFTGVSPRQFTQTLNGIARMMHRPS